MPSSGCGETPNGSRSRTNPGSESIFRSIVDGLVAVILSPSCAACRSLLSQPTRGPVCSRCWASIAPFVPPLCARCGDPLRTWRSSSRAAGVCARCRRRPSAISRSRAIGPYDGALRDILHAMKYAGCRSAARELGGRMRREAAEVLAGASVVVPVPLHPRRRRARGFNQAADLASYLGRPVADVLRRTRATRSQTDLPAAKRHANVRGAFALRRGATVRGLSIVLVDDVATTGATLESCARVLRAAGALDVSALTAARVASRPRE
jgi:ComF family protein